MNNTDEVKKELKVADGSVYVMSRFSQDYWRHGISPQTEETGARISFTFRHIAPHFRNYRTIVGDSNTKNLNFGKGKGTFGRFMPGKRLEAMRIEDIPGPDKIGPVKSIVIHTGINNLNSEEYKPHKAKQLVNLLEKKC